MAAIAGPAIAAVLPFLLEKLFPGKKEKMQQVPSMAPGQMDLLNQLLGGLGGGETGGGPMGAGLSNLQQLLSGDPEAFAKFEAPYQRQFQEQTVPGLAERFSGMGAGAQGSSAFGQQLGQAGAGLSEGLASLRGGLQQGAMGQLASLLGIGMGASPFENIFRPQTGGMGQAMAPGIGAGIGSGLAGLFTSGGGGGGGFGGWLSKLIPGSMSSPQSGFKWGG